MKKIQTQEITPHSVRGMGLACTARGVSVLPLNC